MGYKHTYDTIYTHFQAITNNIYGFGRPFLLLHFFTRPPPVHSYFFPSIFVFTRSNDGCLVNAMYETTKNNKSRPSTIEDIGH